MMPALFRMPAPIRVRVTPEQLRVLDVLALLDGVPACASRYPVSRQVLRNVMNAGLVVCVGLGPARYLLTPVGRVVRARPR